MQGHSWLADDQKSAFATSPFEAHRESVSDYLSPWLLSNGYGSASVRNNLYIEDAQITVRLLNQALEFLQRALCNTVAHYLLAEKGLETWSRVTNYYASYFSVHSLLCLQGRTITRLKLDNEITVQVVPVDLRNHIFGITTSGLGKNPHHLTPWRRYYEIYDRYAIPHDSYELIARNAYTTDPSDESIERNKINYRPFSGFQEIYNLAQHQTFSILFENYRSVLESKTTLEEFLVDLRGLASDPEKKYFARVLLRLAFAGAIILSIRAENSNLEAEWAAMTKRWQDLLSRIFPNPNTCYLLKFVPLIGS